MMKLSLPDGISSQQDLKAVLLEVQQYAKWYLQTAVKNHYSKESGDEQPSISAEAAAIVKEWDKEKPINKEGLAELLDALSSLVANAPNVTVTLAAIPPSGLKKELIAWFREQIDPNTLVNFKFNTTILGGMVVSYRSHTYDWSFRHQILAAREKFPEILRHV